MPQILFIKILPLQNEIKTFVVVWIVLMQPLLSKTTMKGKISKNQGLPKKFFHCIQ